MRLKKHQPGDQNNTHLYIMHISRYNYYNFSVGILERGDILFQNACNKSIFKLNFGNIFEKATTLKVLFA